MFEDFKITNFLIKKIKKDKIISYKYYSEKYNTLHICASAGIYNICNITATKTVLSASFDKENILYIIKNPLCNIALLLALKKNNIKKDKRENRRAARRVLKELKKQN